MRMHIRRSNRRPKSGKKDDRRRSWHLGSNETQGSRRSGHGGFHSTWHFHHSRHSGHPSDNNNAAISIGDDSQPEQRKNFLSASHIEQETATRAPSAPRESSDTAAQTDPSTQQISPLGSSKRGWLKKARHRTDRVWHAIEEFLFPGCRPLHGSHQSSRKGARRSISPQAMTNRAGFSLATIQETVQVARTMRGKEGLRAAGFEFRRLPCLEHQHQQTVKLEDAVKSEEPCAQVAAGNNVVNYDQGRESNRAVSQDTPELVSEEKKDEEVEATLTLQLSNIDQEVDLPTPELGSSKHFCRLCSSVLFHIPSNTRIDGTNRKQFIADGDMYDAVAKLCQEYAQEVMIQQYGLVWVTVCEGLNNDDDNGRGFLKQGPHEPIRALINVEHPLALGQNLDIDPAAKASAEKREYYSQRPTLLIVTGKGKVRAGIFSRQHLLVSGMESSTALPLIHNARKRELNVVIVDPNAHGDWVGNVTFEKSMEKLFPSGEEQQQNGCRMANQDLYILSHSASGSHLVRYLLDDSDHKSRRRLANIRAIAFTDSTHTIQLPRQKGNDGLVNLLESDASIYFRCASAHMSENWSLHNAGHDAPRDEFWRKRFGNIRTCWAGTKEHSLTNWFALSFIWEHFDKFLKPESQQLDNRQDQKDAIAAHE
jgi:hypothetical protein